MEELSFLLRIFSIISFGLSYTSIVSVIVNFNQRKLVTHAPSIAALIVIGSACILIAKQIS